MAEGQSPTKNLVIPMNVPVAIVIAGALIAAAIYFADGSSNGGSTAGTQVANTEGDQPAPAAAPAQPTIGDIREVTSEDHIRGAQNAKVTIIEYSDFECPFCKRFHPTMQQLVDEYPNDVRWVYRHFPLEQLHSKAPKQAEATECAAEQGKFWEMADKIFEVTPANNGLDMAKLPTYAKDAGVPDIPKFQECLDSGKYVQHVQDDIADAQAAGGRGTPYSVVLTADGKKLPLSGAQPYSSVKQLVDEALGS
jgi:protein-disulfide isomerase